MYRLKSKIQFNDLINIIVLLYIIGIFCFERPSTLTIWKIIQSIYIAMILILILIKKKIKLGFYFYWQCCFLIICTSSIFYTINSEISSNEIVILIKNFIILYGFYSYINNKEKIMNICKYISIAGIVLLIVMIQSVDIQTLGKVRLGIGNSMISQGFQANELGSFFVISFYSNMYMLFSEHKKICGIFGIINFIFTLLTGSKRALFCLISGIVIFIMLKYRNKKARNICIIICIIYALYYLILNIPALYNILGKRIEELLQVTAGNNSEATTDAVRGIMIERGLYWFSSKPIIGYGIGTFENLWQIYSGRITYAHNNYIDLLVGIGIIGTLVYYSLYFYITKGLIKTYSITHDDYTIILIILMFLMFFSDLATVTYDYKVYQMILAVGAAYVNIRGINYAGET